MSRLDDLLLAQLDGVLDEAGSEELDRLLREPGAPDAARRLLDLEVALRAGRRLPDAAAGVLARIQARRADRVERGVMARIGASPPAWNRRAGGRRAAFAAAAAALFIVVLLSTFRPAAVARVAAGAPDAVVLRDGRFLAATDGLALAAGDVLSTGPSGIVLRYEGEATRLRLEPETRLRLAGGRDAKRLELREGEVVADVAPQRGGPLVIHAPHGRAEVLGTRLKISAVPDATRVEVQEGRVRMTGSDGRSVEVPARHYALAADGTPLAAAPIAEGPSAPPRVESFSLIAADHPRRPIPGYEVLRDGQTIDLDALPTDRINLQANTDPPFVGSVRFSTAGSPTLNTELIRPYTIVPNNGRDRDTWRPRPGRHTISATPYGGAYANGVRGEPRTITLHVRGRVPAGERGPRITGFSLIHADGPRGPIPGFESLEDGAVIRRSQLPARFNLRAHTSPEPAGSVLFEVDGDASHTLEKHSYYVLASHSAWDPPPGTVRITATAFGRRFANGPAGPPRTLTLRIVADGD